MNNQISARERQHLANVKALACSVCDAPPPSEAHHVKQGRQYTCVALCPDCHRKGAPPHLAPLGWHGQRRAWAVRKMDELDALGKTIMRLDRM